jgi:hypothetical protein
VQKIVKCSARMTIGGKAESNNKYIQNTNHMKEKQNSIINFEVGKIMEKGYDDIISNPGKKIGDALGTIIDVGNTILWPVKLVNERTIILFENNINR